MKPARLLCVALVFGTWGLCSSDARAATVSRADTDGTLIYAAAGSEVNDLTVSLVGTDYVFTDLGFTDLSPTVTVTAGLNCTPPGGGNTASCPAAGVTDIEIRLADGDDRAVLEPATPSVILGGLGDDRLTGGGTADRLEGETGDDTLAGGAGDDELNGEALLLTTTGQNSLDGGPGNDRLTGGAGPDGMLGSVGNDTIYGLDGVDDLDGGADTDDVSGGDGNDVLRGGPGDDRLGDPSIAVMALPPERGDDVFDGGPGNDLLRPGGGPTPGFSDSDVLGGGGGVDSVTYEQRSATVQVSIDGAANDGGPGESDNVTGDVERLVGGQAGDTLLGGPAGDTIDGFRGPDTIRGGAGADTLDGGAEDAESDDVAGGEGDDQVRGNAGDDGLAGDEGNDTVEGGGGDDRAGGGADSDVISGGPGIDVVSGGSGNDRLDGSATGPVGMDGADTLRGGAGDDSLEGGDGDDVMAGGTGVDALSGEAGRDTADYTGARTEVEVSLNDEADDGEQGEGDNVRTDVENVSGGGVEDTFTGSGDANTLNGGSGEDYLDGRRGPDGLLGGGAVDVVRARDGRSDVVDCGRSLDFAIVDRTDRVRRCERSDRGRGRPTLGSDVVVQPTAAGAEFGPPEASRTFPLLDRIEVPINTVADTTKGSVRLTAAGGRRTRQVGNFRGAVFSISQRRSRRPLTDLRLKGGDFRKCRQGSSGNARAAQLSSRTIRRLRARAQGRFRTSGRHSAATVRGTIYIVSDRCDGTLTRVRRGVVRVRDFRRRRTIVLRAGKSYLARAPSADSAG